MQDGNQGELHDMKNQIIDVSEQILLQVQDNIVPSVIRPVNIQLEQHQIKLDQLMELVTRNDKLSADKQKSDLKITSLETSIE